MLIFYGNDVDGKMVSFVIMNLVLCGFLDVWILKCNVLMMIMDCVQRVEFNLLLDGYSVVLVNLLFLGRLDKD